MSANVVATPATKMLARTLLEAARQDSAGSAVIQHLGNCRRGQEAALVASLLGLVVDAVPETAPELPSAPPPLPEVTPETLDAEEERVALWAAQAASATFGVSVAAILRPGDGRPRGVEAKAAHVVQWVLHKHLDLALSLGRIAELTGRRDHTSVMYALRRVNMDPELNKAGRAILAAWYDTEEESA